jgi:hypothetical protein
LQKIPKHGQKLGTYFTKNFLLAEKSCIPRKPKNKEKTKNKYFFFVTKTIKPKQEKQGQFYKKKTRNNRIKKQ